MAWKFADEVKEESASSTLMLDLVRFEDGLPPMLGGKIPASLLMKVGSIFWGRSNWGHLSNRKGSSKLPLIVKA